MIFKPELVRAITLGKKTETRRPTRGDEPCRYKAGRSYAVQPGRGRPAVLRILVTDVRLDEVGTIDFDSARAEGFRTVAEFKVEWVGIHDRAWLETTVDLLGEITTGLPWPDLIADDLLERIGLGERGLRQCLGWLEQHGIVECVDEVWWRSEGAEIDAALARFDARHAHRPVWVIRFEPSREDTPRLLAARPGSARSDYVTNPSQAAAGEPEAVTGADLERLARKGEMTARHWQTLEATNAQLEAQIRSVDDRVLAARRKADAAGVDVDRHVYKIRAAQAAGRPQDVIERWLQVLERVAFTTTLRRAA